MEDEVPSTKRDVILAGARKVFRDAGFENASMDRIAEVAGVSKRTIYNHFGSKDALFETVVDGLVQALCAHKEIDWAPDESLEEQLRAFARAKSSIVEDPRWMALLKVVLAVAVQQPERVRETMIKAADCDQALTRWLREADRAGALRVADAECAATLFWGSVAGTLVWPQIFQEPLEAAARERLLDEIIASFLSRYAPR